MRQLFLSTKQLRHGAFIGLVLVYGCILFALLSSLPFLKGTDAYYYALQSDFWFRTGKVKIPDSSFIFRVLGALQYLGISAECAFWIWFSFAVTMFSGLLVLGAESGKHRQAVQWPLIGFLLLSPSLIFCAIEFPKQFSLWVVLATIPLLLHSLRGWHLYLCLGLWAAVAMAVHRSGALYVTLIFLGVFAAEKRHIKTLLCLTLVPLLAFFVQRLISIDPLGLQDFVRLGEFNLTPAIYSLLAKDALPIAIKIELWISLLAALLILYATYRRKNLSAITRGTVWALLCPAAAPCMSNEVFSAGERFAIFLPPSCLVAFSLIGFELPEKGTMRERGLKPLTWMPLCAAVLLLLAPIRIEYSHPQAISPNYGDYKKLVHVLEPRKIPMLIAHQGFNFFYKFQTTSESFSYEPEPHWNKQRIWRLVYGVSVDEIAYFSSTGCGWDSNLAIRLNVDGYTLMREDCFEKLRGAIVEVERPDLYFLLHKSSMNPSRPRPQFLYEKHRQDEPNQEFPAFPITLG